MANSTFHAQTFRGRAFGVTGAAHGIGEATLRLLIELGATVLAIDNDAQNLNRVAGELSIAKERVVALECDVADDACLKSGIDEFVQRTGRIDGWVNNAMYARRGTVEQQPAEEMNAAWTVNVLAPWKMTRLLLPEMKKNGGSIVNVSSVHAHQTTPAASAYVSTKAALEGLTRAMAVELAGQRIRVNAIVPGYILSYAGTESKQSDPAIAARETALRRRLEELDGTQQPWPTNGLPSDVSNLIAFLLSDASSFITGTSIPIDGGHSADVKPASAKLVRTYTEMEEIFRELQAMGLSKTPTY